MKLKKIVELIQGEPYNIPPEYWDMEFSSVRPLDDAGQNDISFLYDKKYLKMALNSGAAVFIVPRNITGSINRPLIAVDNPRLSVVKVLNGLYPETEPVHSIDSSAVVSEKAHIEQNVTVGCYSVIAEDCQVGEGTIIDSHVVVGKNVHIGKGCRIHAGVVIYENCFIGDNVLLHSGVVIGSDGFGFLQESGKNVKVPQLGRVIVEDDVEIGANTAVDRGMLGDTTIGENTKIDNLVQIAHNVKIGKSCIIAGNSAIGGSAVLEDYVILAGQVGIRDNITIGRGSIVPARTGVPRDVPPQTIVPAEFKRLLMMEGRVNRYGKKIENIEKNLEDSP